MPACLPKQLPVTVARSSKRQVRCQFAGLCYKVEGGKVRVLMVTSRRRGRWILPKGWPEDGLTPAACAAKEAYEEAGVRGRHYDTCLGVWSYVKMLDKAKERPFMAMVYAIEVTELMDDYRENGQRDRQWFSRKAAAERVLDPTLAEIIRTFDPAILGQNEGKKG